MSRALNLMLVVMGVWLIVSPLALLYSMPGMAVSVVCGVVVLMVGLVAVKKSDYKAGLNYFSLMLGAALAVWGIAGAVLGMGAGLNEVVSGVLVAVFSYAATRFTSAYGNARFYDRGGVEMVDLKDLRIKDNTILMKANLLQSMPSTIYVRPDEVWKVLNMVTFDLIKGLPGYLIAGYRTCKEQEREAKAKAQQ